MDHRKLQRQLRRVQRMARYLASVEQRLKSLCSTLQVTDEELAFLLKHNDGYLTVVEARDKSSHITLSGADEAARAAAASRAKARDAAKAAVAAKRREELVADKGNRKKLKVSKKMEKMLEIAKVLSAAGVNPLTLSSEKTS